MTAQIGSFVRLCGPVAALFPVGVNIPRLRSDGPLGAQILPTTIPLLQIPLLKIAIVGSVPNDLDY